MFFIISGLPEKSYGASNHQGNADLISCAGIKKQPAAHPTMYRN
jgi:hypothetical protein